MLKYYWRLLTIAGVIALVLMIGGMALAASWAYKFPTSITDTSGSARTYYPVIMGYDGQTYIDGGFTVNGTDTNMQYASTSVRYMLSTTNVTSVVTSLPANGSVTHDLYTGYSPVQTGFSIIPGDGGYITASDHATAELGNNWSIDWTNAYLNTGTAGNLVNKDAAVNIATGSGNVTATIYDDATTATYRPNAAGDETNLTPSAGNNYSCSGDDNDATFVSTTSLTYVRDLYNFADPSPALHGPISSITFNFRIRTNTGASAAYAKPVWKLGGTAYEGTEQSNDTIDFVTKNQAYATNPNTSAAWEWSDLASAQIGVTLHGTGGAQAHSADIWIVVNYTPDASVSQTVAAGEQDLLVGGDFPFIYLASDALTALPPVSDNLVMNVPLTQIDCSASPFNTIDATAPAATVSGAVRSTFGYTFDGLNDYIEVAHNANQLVTQGFSIEALIKPGPAAGRIFDKTTDTSATDGYTFYTSGSAGSGTVVIGVDGGVGVASASASVVRNGTTQYHVMATVNSAGLATLYVNGAVSGTPASTNATSGITTTNAIRIGNRSTATDRPYGGDILFVRLYNRVLTADEVLQNYNAINGDISIYSTTVSVADNSNDWTLNEDDAVVYCDSLEFTISGAQALYYAPTVMLTGATLPDDSVNSNDGTIVWGSNSNISLAYGAMVSYSTTDFSVASQSSMTVPTQSMPSQWFASGSNIAALPFYNEVVLPASTATGIAAQTFYVIFIAGLAFIVAAIIGGITQSGLIFLIVAASILMVGASMTIIPMWIPFAVILAGSGLVFLRRQLA